ncbi:hypothetical protein [Nocardiopsis sp. FIRDI 009]|uniref:hypothetical protein n=1 Tax=Nocardiopsis sp. FIRDI 009 TaxID=714197 RepID=UPI001300719B|nr:hypothetical protein [Nocardiopsis sp. FIRDI 009]
MNPSGHKEAWRLSRVGYIWAFDWLFGIFIPRVRSFYVDFFVEVRSQGCAGRVEAGLAKAVFQVDSALAPVRMISWILALLGLEAFLSYAAGGQLPPGFSRGFEVAILLGFSYFGSVGVISTIEFLRVNKMIRNRGEGAQFKSLSSSMQITFFSFLFGISSIVLLWASPYFI